MRRRDFIAALGGAATWPYAAAAQQPGRTRRIGVLMPLAENDDEGRSRIGAFRTTLHDLGWTEGGNLHIDYRWAAGDPDRIRAYAAELVGLKPDLVVANSTPVMAAFRA